ncbi:MAG: hypothetical protein ACYSTY_03265 [Planctomycetota bacterium]|jgi:hypothetical protein
MSGGFDWVFWSVGGVLGLAGLLLALWALFADRARGRRRCPKCWYDLSGTPGLVCSECGYIAKRERRLHKTHRRWRWALMGALTGSLGVAGALTPRIRRDGWVSVVPTTALVLAAPWLDTPHVGNVTCIPPIPSGFTNPLCADLVRRAQTDRLWEWQWRLLVKRCSQGEDPPWAIPIVMRGDEGALPRDKPAVLVPVLEHDRAQAPASGFPTASKWPWFAAVDLRVVTTPHDAEGDAVGVGPALPEYVGSRGRGLLIPPDDIWVPYQKMSLIVDPGIEELALLASVQRRTGGQRRAPRWSEIWSGVIRIPASVVRSEGDIAVAEVRPLNLRQAINRAQEESDERIVSVLASAALRCLCDGGQAVIRVYEGIRPAGPMELWRDDRCVGTARIWLQDRRLYVDRLQATGDGVLELPPTDGPGQSSWSLRFRKAYIRQFPEFMLALRWDDDEKRWTIE